jgi:hypothetical protein
VKIRVVGRDAEDLVRGGEPTERDTVLGALS